MGNESICFSISNKVLQEQLALKNKNAQIEDSKRILLEKDEQIALSERSILEKNSAMSAIQRQNDELLQTVHAVRDCTKWGESEQQVMLNALVGRSDTKNSLDLTLPPSECYREKLISENQISSSHQELELLKFEMSAKTLSRNSNAICLPSFLAEGNKEDIINVQRNIWAMQEENSTINGTAKIVEGHVTRDPYLSDNFSVETADIILESPLKSMSKEQLISHYIRVVAALRRDKEIILSEKTEEIYRLKRQCLRERGNGREIAALKRKLGYTTKKLDEFIKGNEQLVVSRRFSDEESAITSELEDELQDDNRNMLELIAGEEKESKDLFDGIGLEQSSREGYLQVQIEELENEKEAIKATNKNEIDILRICLEETIQERTMSLNLAIKESAELREQKNMLEDIICDKDRILSLALKEKEDQKQQIILRVKQLEEKENEYKKQQNLLQQSLKECQELKEQNSLLETLTQQKERALNLLTKEQEELKKQVALLEGAVQENKNCTSAASDDLEEAGKENMLEDIICDKDRILSLALKEKEDQKQQIILREKQLEEKENEYKKQQNLLQQSLKECQQLKEQNSLLETLTQQKERALNLLTKEQEELKKQVVLLEGAVQENKNCTSAASDDLEEAGKEKMMLEGTIRDRERTLDQVMNEEEKRMELERVIAEKDIALIFAQKEIENQTNEKVILKECLEQKEVSLQWALMHIKEKEKQKEFSETKVQKLEDCITDLEMNQKQSEMQLARYIRNVMDASLKFEETALEKLHHNFLRLKEVERQLVILSGLANSFAVRESHYRKMCYRRYCNLQKAEEEVDLLGDEVDNLLSLLGKVCIVLNHYAPVLQHYPGIPEIVNLIKKEISGRVDA